MNVLLVNLHFTLQKPYIGLHLTPSQTEALSQKVDLSKMFWISVISYTLLNLYSSVTQLGQLHKVGKNSDSKCQDVKGKHLCDVEHFRNSPTQSFNSDVSCNFPSISCAGQSSFTISFGNIQVIVHGFSCNIF